MKEFVEKLIERLEELKEDIINKNCPVVPNSEDCEMEHSCASCFLNAPIKIVKQLAEEYVPETNVGNWIPCSERLPDAGRRYLVIAVWKDGDFKKHSIYTFVFGTDGLWHSHNYEPVSCEVIAWQPLPEPYKPEQQKKMPTDHFTERFNRVL